jgi:hypothetical protein
MRFLIPVLLFVTACTPATTSPPPDDPPAVNVPHFEPAGAAADGTLFLTADISVPDAPRLVVFGQGLGDVFGFAFHLTLEGGTSSEATLEPVLGSDAYSLVSPRGAEVAFGAARPGLSAGTVPLAGPMRLASVRLPADATQVVARLERAQVRDAKGELVAVRAIGGTLVLKEVSP